MHDPLPALSADQSALAAEHYPLAVTLARLFARGRAWLEDELSSTAGYALIQAARAFRVELEIPFGHYARKRILGALSDLVRTEEGRRVEADESAILNASQRGRPAEDLAIAAEEFDRLIDRFPTSHHALLRLLFERGLDRREAAEALGITRLRLSRRLSAALDSFDGPSCIRFSPSKRRRRRPGFAATSRSLLA